LHIFIKMSHLSLTAPTAERVNLSKVLNVPHPKDLNVGDRVILKHFIEEWPVADGWVVFETDNNRRLSVIKRGPDYGEGNGPLFFAQTYEITESGLLDSSYNDKIGDWTDDFGTEEGFYQMRGVLERVEIAEGGRR